MVNESASGHFHEHTHANILYNLHHPSVPLEHIDSVKNIECPEKGVITFSFSQPELFRHAMNTWPKNGEDFILIDNTDGCGDAHTRTFFYVDEYTMDKKTHSVRATGQMLDGNEEHIVHSWEANWGHRRQARPHSTSEPAANKRWWDPIAKRFAAPAPAPTPAPILKERFGIDDLNPVSIYNDASTAVGGAVSKASTAVGGVVSKASTKAEDLKTKVETKAEDLKTKAETKIDHVADKASSVADNVISSLPKPDVSADFHEDIDIHPDYDDETPFGQKGLKLPTFSGLTPYCLDCGLKGKLSMGGPREGGGWRRSYQGSHLGSLH